MTNSGLARGEENVVCAYKHNDLYPKNLFSNIDTGTLNINLEE